jgi:hypothetical protein
MSLASVSVGIDVDRLIHYYRIHGHPPPSHLNKAWEQGVTRFLTLLKELEFPATFYCVAEDLDSDTCESALMNQKIMRRMVDEGHEIGNHSWHHPYSLTQLTPNEQKQEIQEAQARLQDHARQDVVGFRAPGYHTHAQFTPFLKESGHRYESSAFPCIPYYMAKACVLGVMKLRGKKSQSILGHPSILLAPRLPYRASGHNPYRRASLKEESIVSSLPHFPISTHWGIPLIGTAFTALGQWSLPVCRHAASTLKQGQHLTLEFHAADLLSLADDALDPLLESQFDLKVSVDQKYGLFKEILSIFKQHAQPLRLDQHSLTIS